MEIGGLGIEKGCYLHPSDEVKGFCRDCQVGVCFRCAIGKHRSHTIANIDELER
jgi:hypothetical protein